MRTLVIIPTYNERENIGTVVVSFLEATNADVAVLIVDDASPDGTGELANVLSMQHSDRVFVLHRKGKLGLGSAYLAGFRYALDRGYDAVCEMDADGSHDPHALPRLIALVEQGADLAIGSRRVPGGNVVGWGPHRHLMSSGAMSVARLALGLKARDVTSGFRCYRAALAAELLAQPIVSNGYAFQEETLFYAERLGYKVVETPIVFRDRLHGQSKLSLKEVTQFFSIIVTLLTKKVRRKTAKK
jgi:dolichol-phosphate mannosyltransferase